MEIRPAKPADLPAVAEIDGTVEATRYLHLEQSGDGLQTIWRLEARPLREKLISPNRISDDVSFTFRQLTGGIEEGLALVAEHNGDVVAMLAARIDPQRGVLELLDVRVDYDYRRQGLATAMLFATVNAARERQLRAVTTVSITNNLPAAELLKHCGFVLAGLDSLRTSNHDLVREQASLIWYAPLD